MSGAQQIDIDKVKADIRAEVTARFGNDLPFYTFYEALSGEVLPRDNEGRPDWNRVAHLHAVSDGKFWKPD